MYAFKYHFRYLSFLMSFVLVTAPMLSMARSTIAASPLADDTFGNTATTHTGAVLKTAHARALSLAFGVEHPAMLEIGPDQDGNGLDEVFIWHSEEQYQMEGDDPTPSGEFEFAAELLIDSFSGTLITETETLYVVMVTTERYLTAGVLHGIDGIEVPVVGVYERQTVEYLNSDMDPVTLDSFVIGDIYMTVGETVNAVEDAAASDQNDPDEPVVSCVSEWVGNNGFQCCSLWPAFNAKKDACWHRFKAEALRCGGYAAGGVGACLAICLKLLTPNPLSVKSCLIGCGIIGAVGLGLCIWSAWENKKACESDAEAWYWEKLGSTGCYPPPPDMVP